MNITKSALRSLPDEWLENLAWELDPDGDYQRDGFGAASIVWECIDYPDVRESVEEMLSVINEETSSV